MGCGIISGIVGTYDRATLDVRPQRFCVSKSLTLANSGGLGRDPTSWTIYELRALDILLKRSTFGTSFLGCKIPGRKGG